MAKRANVEKNLLKLIYYPNHATPPDGAEGSMLTWVARLRAMAAEALREEAGKTEETATPPEPKPLVSVPCKKKTPPCENAAVPHSRKTGKDRRAPAPTPTFQQICDKACEMAKEANVEKDLLKLVYYPDHATPPDGALGSMMTWVARIRAMAGEALREEMAALPRPKLPRRKPIRPRPVLTRYWTRLPHKYAKPPPRRRRFIPPGLYRAPAGPPLRLAGDSAISPCRHHPERLVFYDWLFGN